jgi:hypothetical protein
LLTFARDELVARTGKAERRIHLVSPFLTLGVAKEIAAANPRSAPAERRLLTALTERGVRAQALDPRALRVLLEAGFEIGSIPNLHAKLSLIDDWGLIGSGNLTGSGLGGSKGANIELGVILSASLVEASASIFARWWSRGSPVTGDLITRYEELPAFREGDSMLGDVGDPIELTGTRGLGDVLKEPRAAGGGRAYWIKSNYHRWDEESWWQTRKWISDWRRAPYTVGDLIVLYLAARDGGPAACAAVVRVTEASEFAPDFVREERDFDAAKRWPYVTKIEVLADVPPFEGVPLALIGKNGQSVQGGYCRIDRDEFDVLAEALAS